MGDEIASILGKYTELPKPEPWRYLIAAGRTWAGIEYKIDDFSCVPVLWNHLNDLSASWEIQFAAVQLEDRNERYYNPSVLRVVINDDVYLWAENDAYLEHGLISIVGNTEMVNVIVEQICGETDESLPEKSEFLLTRAERVGWLEARFARGELPIKKIIELVQTLDQSDVFVPMQHWGKENPLEVFAVFDGLTYLRAARKFDEESWELIGRKELVATIGSKLKELAEGEFIDWMNR